MNDTSPHAPKTTPELPAQRRALLAGIGGLAAGAMLTRSAHAGPLNPPAGPVASTGKTLTEVEPRIAINSTNTRGDANSVFRISQPGSYYLTGNVTGVSGRHGIEIAANNVSVDLMGFTLLGVAGSLSGVAVDVPRANIAVCNGIVTGWGDDGVDLAGSGPPVSGFLVEHLIASENAGSGIRAGIAAIVRHCTSHTNGFFGIVTSGGSVIAHCAANGNLGSGISTANNCTIVHCTSRSNAGSGILGSSAATIAHCTSAGNGVDGIVGGGGSTITHCTSGLNTGDGIQVPSSCAVLANSCRGNGAKGDGAGIRAVQGSNRIEGNACSSNTRGIDADGAGNIILGNACSANTTNYDIAAGNRYGPIIDLTAGATPGVSGNAAASTVNSTDPWANFAY